MGISVFIGMAVFATQQTRKLAPNSLNIDYPTSTFFLESCVLILRII